MGPAQNADQRERARYADWSVAFCIVCFVHIGAKCKIFAQNADHRESSRYADWSLAVTVVAATWCDCNVTLLGLDTAMVQYGVEIGAI